MSEPLYLVQRENVEGGDVVTVTMNRPKTMNAASAADLPLGVKVFDEIAADPKVRAVILTGAGKAFSAGADLTVAMEIFQGTMSPTNREYDLVAAIERVPCPIIGAINGPAITGGFEVALACDILIASTDAVFSDTHAKFGIHPCWGLSQRLQRAVGQYVARHISLSAGPIPADQAAKWGLVSQVVPAEELMPTVKALAKEIASNHPKMVNVYKNIINRGGDMSLGAARELERKEADAYYKSITPEDFAAMGEFLMARSGGKKSKL